MSNVYGMSLQCQRFVTEMTFPYVDIERETNREGETAEWGWGG